MSLALNMFFWDSTEWGGSVPPVIPTEEPTPTSGGGGGHKKKKKEYYRSDEHFWLIRERYLRLLAGEGTPPPVTIHNPSPTPNEIVYPASKPPRVDYIALPRYKAEKESLLLLAKTSTSIQQLQSYGNRLIQLNAAIIESRRLQAIHDERTRRTKARIKKKRLLKLYSLAAATLLLFSKGM